MLGIPLGIPRLAQRKAFLEAWPDSRIMYLDETGFNLHTMPNHGWAPPVQYVATQLGRRVNMMLAIGTTGLRFPIFRGSVNSRRLRQFLLHSVFPLVDSHTPDIPRLLIMDNANSKVARITSLFPHHGPKISSSVQSPVGRCGRSDCRD